MADFSQLLLIANTLLPCDFCGLVFIKSIKVILGKKLHESIGKFLKTEKQEKNSSFLYRQKLRDKRPVLKINDFYSFLDSKGNCFLFQLFYRFHVTITKYNT